MRCPLRSVPVTQFIPSRRIALPARCQIDCRRRRRRRRHKIIRLGVVQLDAGCLDPRHLGDKCLRGEIRCSRFGVTLAGGLALLFLFPSPTPLPCFGAGERLRVASVAVLAARLTLQLLLREQSSDADKHLRSERPLREQAAVPAVPTPEFAIAVDAHVLHGVEPPPMRPQNGTTARRGSVRQPKGCSRSGTRTRDRPRYRCAVRSERPRLRKPVFCAERFASRTPRFMRQQGNALERHRLFGDVNASRSCVRSSGGVMSARPRAWTVPATHFGVRVLAARTPSTSFEAAFPFRTSRLRPERMDRMNRRFHEPSRIREGRPGERASIGSCSRLLAPRSPRDCSPAPL